MFGFEGFGKAKQDLKSAMEEAVSLALVRARTEWFKLEDASEQLLKTKAEVEQLKIEKDRINEQHARERREIEHKIGLEQKRQVQELELGKREALVAVKESNLVAEQKRFEEQMTFIKDQFNTQYETLNEHMSQITKRLPEITWNINDKRVSSGAKR